MLSGGENRYVYQAKKKKEKTTVYRFLYDLLYWPVRQRNLEDLKLVSVDSKAFNND